MKNPNTFQIIIFSFVFVLSFINLTLSKKLLFSSLSKFHVLIYFIATCLLGYGIFTGWPNTIPFGPQISRFCVFWFIIHIIILPFWSALFIIKAICQNLLHLFIEHYVRIIAAGVLLLAFMMSAYGAFYESFAIRTVKYDIYLENLQGEANGLKIAQITDLHLGIYSSLQDLQNVLQQAKSQKADVLVITGDLIDDTALLQDMIKILDEFSSEFPHGIYYCWGNHEYFRGYSVIEQALLQSKVRVLKNENVLLLNEKTPLYLLGIDYSFNRSGGAKQEYDTMLAKALKNIPTASTKILLAHHSITIDNAFEQGIDLTLTGHTHGTQIGFNGKPLVNAFKYTRGMYKNNQSYAYVSTGVSGWFPFRFGCPPEVVIFTLKSF